MPVPKSPAKQNDASPQQLPSSEKTVLPDEEVTIFGQNCTRPTKPTLRFSPDFIGRSNNSKRREGTRGSPKKQENTVETAFRPVRQFKMLRNDSKLVKAVLHGHGFELTDVHSFNFDVLWTGNHLRPFCLRSLSPNQRVNHFPRSFELTRKDRLYRNIERMQTRCGKDNFNFVPEFFVTPDEIDKLTAKIDSTERTGSDLGNRFPFIVKPVGSSRGRGIFVAVRADQVPLGSLMLCSRYITDPFLIQGHKFDIRLYVAVTSVHPLVCYLYQEGMARLASKKYNQHFRSYEDSCVHLTNYSVNKLNDKYIRHREGDSESSGHKWTLSGLLNHLKQEHKADTKFLMLRIEDLIIKTLLSCQSPVAAACLTFVPYEGNCFEVFGFDILLDSKLKPWLLEVNLSPSLSCDTPLDFRIKSGMICDLLNLAGIPDAPLSDEKGTVEEFSQNVTAEEITVMDLPEKETKDAELGKQEHEAIKVGVKLRRRNSRKTVAAVKSLRKNRFHNMLKRQCNMQKKGKVPILSKNRSVGTLTEGHVQRVRDEETRRGKFHRLFPQKHTWSLYSELLEDLGVGRNFDENLHKNLFPLPDDDFRCLKTVREIRTLLIDTDSISSIDSASDECLRYLEGPIERCSSYEKKMEMGKKTKHGIYSKLRFHSTQFAQSFQRKSAAAQDQRKRNRTWSNISQDQQGSTNLRQRLDADLSELVIDNPNDIDELIVPLPPADCGELLKCCENGAIDTVDFIDCEKLCDE